MNNNPQRSREQSTPRTPRDICVACKESKGGCSPASYNYESLPPAYCRGHSRVNMVRTIPTPNTK